MHNAKIKCMHSQCVAMQWKDEQSPTTTRWTNEVASCLPNERIMDNLKGKPGEFKKI